MLAARNGFTEIVVTLVEAGADVTLRNEVNMQNCNVLLLLSRSMHNRLERLHLCWPLKVDMLGQSRN